MELELGVQITRPVGDLTFASTETDAVFVLFAHLPGFTKDEIEVELNEAGTEISISSRGETGERSFIEAEISGRIRISHDESIEGFRKAFPIPNNVVLDRIEVGFEEEEGILFVLLPKSTREEEPSRVEIEEINEENIREEIERTSMTVEVEETIPDYNEDKAQEQKNLGEVEPKKSTEKLEEKPDGKPEASHRETKIAIEDKEDRESELIIEELDFPITPSISEEPIAFKSAEEEEEEEEEEENTLEEEAPEQKNLDELELSKSSKALESEPEGETEPESKEIAIRAQTDDKEEETDLIIEEPDFTMTPPPLEKPIVSEAFEPGEEEEEEEKALEEKEQKQKNLDELEPKRSLGESEGELDEEIEPERKKMAIEAKIIDEEEEESEHIIKEPDFTITPPRQEKPIASKASDSKEEEKKEEKEEEEEKATKEKVQDLENLDELGSKKSLEALEGEPVGKTKLEHREMAIEAQSGDKQEEKSGFIMEEPDFIRTPPLLEEPVAPKVFELKEEEEKATEEKVQDQENLDELGSKKSSEALEGEPDGKIKPEHREMAIEVQPGDKEEEKTEFITEEPDFIRTPPPLEEPVAPKAFELKEEEEKAIAKKVQDQENLDELESKKSSEALEGEPDGKTKPEHREMAIEAQPGDKEEEKIGFITEEPDFIRTSPPLEEPVAPKVFELKEEKEKAIEEKVQDQENLDELGSKKSSEALEGEPDGKIKPEHREMAIEAQPGDKEEEKIGFITEEPDFIRTPPPLEEPVAPKAFELKEEEEKAIEEKVQDQENLDELGSKKSSEALEGEPDEKTKPEHREMAIEAQPGDKEEEKTGYITKEPDFIRTPPPLEEPVAPKAFELKEEEEKAIEEKVQDQENLDELGSKKSSEALEGEPDEKTKPEHREMAIEAQPGDKEEEKTGYITKELDFIRTPPPLEEPVAPKAFELKEEEEKAIEEKAPEQKDLDELEPKKRSEALEGEPDKRKTKPEHKEMAIKAQTGDKEQEKIELTREEPDFTRTPPPSEEPVTSKASELKEEEEKALEEEVLEQKDLDKLKPKKISKALEDEPDREIGPKHEEMAIEAQTGDKEEEQTGFIIEEPDFSRTPPSTKEPVASKDSELEKEKEKATEEKVPEQKNLDELEPKKISEAQEGEFYGETRAEHEEMTIEAQTDSKEEEQTGLTKEEPDFTKKPPLLTEPTTSKASELKEEEEKKTTEEKAQEMKNLDELELEKGSEASEHELDREIEPEPVEMAIEAPSEHKEEEQIGIHREEPEFTIAPPALEEPILSNASKLKEEEVKKTYGEDIEEPKNLEEKIQSKASKEEEKEENEKALEEKPQEQKSPDELEAKKSLEELEGEPYRETEPEPKKPAIEIQTEYKEEEKIGCITEEPDFTIPPPPLEDLIASKVSESKEEEEEEQQEEAPTKETPYSLPISPILMAKPELAQELLDTTDSHEERDRKVEVPGRALETFESTESPKLEEDRHGFGEEDAKEPKNAEEIAYDPAPKTLTRTVTPEDGDSDRRRDGEHEVRETETRALQEDDQEIASDVDGGEDGSREEEEEGESSDRDREESRGEMETTEEEKEKKKNGMNRRGEKAPRRRRRRRRRGSSFQIPPAAAIASSAFILTLVGLVIRLMKKRRSHAVR